MADLGAIVSLSGPPLTADAAEVFLQAHAQPATELRGMWTSAEGQAALAWSTFCTLPEDRAAAQPLIVRDGQLAICADARIDNRAELLTRLPALRDQASALTDAHLILAAYEAWGDACLTRLHGDFAFVLWDARQRRLMAARDMVGMRPLLYAQANGRLYLSSSLHAFLVALPNRPALNESVLAGYVGGELACLNTGTMLAGVARLEAGYKLVVEAGQLKSPERYDHWGSVPAPACRTDDDWLAGFRDVLTTAVRDRMRVPEGAGVGFSVSGGLDSSALACVAHDLVQSPVDTRMYSMVFEHMPSADEREYFEAVAEKCARFTSTRVLGDGLWAYREYGTDGGFQLDEPEFWPIRGQVTAFFGAAATDGCRALLWGNGGDLVTGLYVSSDKAMWRAMPLRDKLAELRHHRRLIRGMVGWRRRRGSGFAPLLDDAVAPLRRRGLLPERSEHPAERMADDDGLALDQPYAHHIYENLGAPQLRILLDLHRRYARHYHIEQRQPYLDRRLIEFAMRLPRRLLYWRGRARIILRDSMSGVLPEKVRNRRSKSGFGGMVEAGFRNEQARIRNLTSDTRLEALGFVDGEAVRRLADLALQKGSATANRQPAPPISSLMSVEIWLRTYGY